MSQSTAILDSPRFRFFFWSSLALLLINLLVINDYAPLWEPWEGLNWWQAREHPSQFPHFFYAWWQEMLGGEYFSWRLPTVLLLPLSLGLWYFGARPIFGQRSSQYTLLVLASCWTLVFAAKLAVNDLWLFLSQMLFVLALLRFLKQGTTQWRIAIYATALLALAMHSWSTVVLITVLSLYLQFVHPQGKKLAKIFLWLSLPLLMLAPASPAGYLLTYGQLSYWKYLLCLFLGLLPWAGFFLGSLADLIYKLRRQEEMAIILAGILLASLAAQSPLAILAFALLIARQISAYFVPNYPYRSLVKGFAVLHLIFSFCIITYALLSAFAQLGAVGFRGVMSLGAIYWMLTFIAVIGLYSYRRDMILGGMAWGALLAMLLFWLQLFPLLESQSWRTSELMEKVPSDSDAMESIFVKEELLQKYPSWRTEAHFLGRTLASFEPTTDLSGLNKNNTLITDELTSLDAKTFTVIDSLHAYSWSQRDSVHFYLWQLK